MGAGAGIQTGKASPERRSGTLENMCGAISDLRERAASVEAAAQVIEKRILGPTPAAEERPDIAKVSEPCVVAMVNNDAEAIRAHLVQIANSIARITEELGPIGE